MPLPRAALLRSCLAAALLLAAGCGSRINEENSKKIKGGMTLQEVEEILGKKGQEGSGIRPGTQLYTWDDANPPKNRILVEFRNGKVDGLVTGSFAK